MLRRFWNGFSKGMEAIGHFISRNIITPILFLVLGAIFSIFAKTGDPLRLKRHEGESLWLDRPPHPDSLEKARSLH